MWVRLVRAHFTNHICICGFLLPIYSYVSVANKFKLFCPPDALVVWSSSAFDYPLTQLAQFVGVKCIPYLLVLGMFLQLCVLKGMSRFFVKYRHLPVKDKFSRVMLDWGMLHGSKISCVWERVLYDRLSGNRDQWRLMWTRTLGNGFRHVCLLGMVCLHPCIWCLHPWSRRRCPWKAHHWRLRSRFFLVQPWRWWCQGYASILCWGYVRFAPFYAVPNFWFGLWRHYV